MSVSRSHHRRSARRLCPADARQGPCEQRPPDPWWSCPSRKRCTTAWVCRTTGTRCRPGSRASVPHSEWRLQTPCCRNSPAPNPPFKPPRNHASRPRRTSACPGVTDPRKRPRWLPCECPSAAQQNTPLRHCRSTNRNLTRKLSDAPQHCRPPPYRGSSRQHTLSAACCASLRPLC